MLDPDSGFSRNLRENARRMDAGATAAMPFADGGKSND
jgi:hypothetical protein